MSGATSATLTERAAALRAQFARSFAEPQHLDLTPREDFLGIRLGDAPYALRLADIAGLFAGKKITRVPGPNAALYGIASFRGSILPVYNLTTVAGFPLADPPHWLALSASAPIAWGFSGFDGHLRCTDADLAASAETQTDDPRNAGLVRTYLTADTITRPVMELKAVIESIVGPSSGPHLATGA
jgi:purine-binding chemotaxis protein CheW